MLTPSPNGARWPEPEPLANPGRFSLRGADRADAAAVGQPGSQLVDDGLELGAVCRQRAGGLVQGEGEAADLGVADGLGAVGVAG